MQGTEQVFVVRSGCTPPGACGRILPHLLGCGMSGSLPCFLLVIGLRLGVPLQTLFEKHQAAANRWPVTQR
eukprot:365452-Chlamydomonas_euryale.AAC.17